jgi:hypothetical protein
MEILDLIHCFLTDSLAELKNAAWICLYHVHKLLILYVLKLGEGGSTVGSSTWAAWFFGTRGLADLIGGNCSLFF